MLLTFNAFGSTFAFFPVHKPNAKKCKRATKPTHHDNKKRNEQTEKRTTANRGFAKWWVQY